MHYIDIHNHTIWGVDDGIQEKEETIQALKNASNDGIVGLCVTPHIKPGEINETLFNTIKQRFSVFESIASDYGIQAFLGSEVLINYDLFDVIDNELYLTINNTNYLLVEFNLGRDITSIEYIDEYLQDLIDRGFRPIIAHVERYFPKGIDLSIVKKWKNYGCIFQMNRTSLLGIHGKVLKENSIKLLKNKWVSLVSSDAHSAEGMRKLKLSDTYEVLGKLVGYNNARILLYDNPNYILNNLDTVSMR